MDSNEKIALGILNILPYSYTSTKFKFKKNRVIYIYSTQEKEDMGFKIGKALNKSKTGIFMASLHNKILAVDAMNVFYPFVFIAMKSKEAGRTNVEQCIGVGVSGFLRRNAEFIKTRIAPIYALEGGERTFLKECEDQDSISVFQGVMEGCLKTIELLGFPVIHTKSEGEAQASYLVNKGDAYACASQDYDCLLFGAERTVMNLKLTARDGVFMIELQNALEELGLTRTQLVDASMLIGTDFSEGVKGVGVKSAINLIKEHGSIEALNEARVKLKNKIIYVPEEEIKTVRGIFLDPDVNKSYPKPDWKIPDLTELRKELVGNYGCSPQKIDAIIYALKKIDLTSKQKSIDSFFS